MKQEIIEYDIKENAEKLRKKKIDFANRIKKEKFDYLMLQSLKKKKLKMRMANSSKSIYKGQIISQFNSKNKSQSP